MKIQEISNKNFWALSYSCICDTEESADKTGKKKVSCLEEGIGLNPQFYT